MNKALIVIVAAVLLGAVGYGVSVRNNLVAMERRIVAQQAETENVYSAIFSNIRSQGLSVEQYRAGVIEALNAAMSGRYGSTGADSALLFVREQNPTIGQDVFLKLQSAIEGGYAAFQRAQRTKLDIIREYETALQTFPSNMVAAVSGYPTVDLEKLSRLVLTQETRNAFSTGTAQPIDPFKKN